MSDVTFETLFEEAKKLPANERLRLMEMLAASLQPDLERKTDWHTALRATYGILADDPIERPPQPPLEERDPIE